jgi:hypothetical protein
MLPLVVSKEIGLTKDLEQSFLKLCLVNPKSSFFTS